VEKVKGKNTKIQRVDKLMQGINRQVVSGERRAGGKTVNGQLKRFGSTILSTLLPRPGLTAPQ